MTEPTPATERPWAAIHRDFKTTSADGTRRVLVLNPTTGGTELVEWSDPTGEQP